MTYPPADRAKDLTRLRDPVETNAQATNPVPGLLEALRWTLSILDKSEEYHPGSIHRMLSDAGEQRWKDARAVLAKAEEKTA